jgi:hypothetical protein
MRSSRSKREDTGKAELSAATQAEPGWHCRVSACPRYRRDFLSCSDTLVWTRRKATTRSSYGASLRQDSPQEHGVGKKSTRGLVIVDWARGCTADVARFYFCQVRRLPAVLHDHRARPALSLTASYLTNIRMTYQSRLIGAPLGSARVLRTGDSGLRFLCW